MNYKNQLILTGMKNDVGEYTRTNVPASYRAGIELQGDIFITSKIKAGANLAISKNKVKNFNEFLDDYDLGGQKTYMYKSTDIALSPNIIGGATFSFMPRENFELSLLSKYVSTQYLDNTENEMRKIDAYYLQDARIIYSIKKGWLKQASIIGQLNNIFNKKYEANGYTYSYIYGGKTITENFYYPMAGTNFMIGVNIKL
jgi:iron complex outermembrane receptor protein